LFRYGCITNLPDNRWINWVSFCLRSGQPRYLERIEVRRSWQFASRPYRSKKGRTYRRDKASVDVNIRSSSTSIIHLRGLERRSVRIRKGQITNSTA
jgi:hypothetical protein